VRGLGEGEAELLAEAAEVLDDGLGDGDAALEALGLRRKRDLAGDVDALDGAGWTR
jgi:hypothetical protein